jgi:hypothetical protein
MNQRIGLLLPAMVSLLVATTQLNTNSGESDNVIRGKFGEQEPYHWDVFVSHCKKDRRYWNRINTILVPMRRKGVRIYSYDMVEPGAVIREEARSAMLTSAVVVLLMSADYIASALMEHELPDLLDQVENHGRRILWLQVGRFDSKSMGRLTRYQKVGAESSPLDSLSGPERDSIYMDLVEAVWNRLNECGRCPSSPTVTPEEL